MKWIYLILCLTAYNIGFDWLWHRLGTCTIAWEGGVITAIFWAWLFCRSNDRTERPMR